MEWRLGQELGPEFKPVERGWCLGSESFRLELLAAAVARVGPSNYGAERQAAGAVRAERLVKASLQTLGWTEKELSRRPKGDSRKVGIARHLRAETTMTLRWVADRLHMGSWTYVSNLLRENSQ
jgi:hypothetical protein